MVRECRRKLYQMDVIPSDWLTVRDDICHGLVRAGVHLVLAVDGFHVEPFQPFHARDNAAFTVCAVAFNAVDRIQVLPDAGSGR